MASNLIVARGGVEYVPPISLAFWRWTACFLMIRRTPRSKRKASSEASDVYKRQIVYKVKAIIPGEIAANKTQIKKSELNTVLTKKASSIR